MSLAVSFSAQAVNEEDARALWARAYQWMRVAQDLELKGEYSLANGGFAEALRQFETVAEKFPEFEPELVGFRLKRVKQAFEDSRSELTEADLKITKRYLLFIQQIDRGAKLRWLGESAEALAVLKSAQRELSSITALKPASFSIALAPQKERLDEEVSYLSKGLAQGNEVSASINVQQRTPTTSLKPPLSSPLQLPTNPTISISSVTLFPN